MSGKNKHPLVQLTDKNGTTVEITKDRELKIAGLSLDIIAAANGTFIVNDTDEKTVNHYAIVVLEDTVFASIKVAGVDVMASYISTPATAIKAGAIIRPLSGVFSAVDLTSGSVALILQ